MVDTGDPKSGVEASRDAWREVGDRFEDLGRSLARALRASWESKPARGPLLTVLRQVDSELQGLIDRLESEEQAAAAVVKIPVSGPSMADLPVGTMEVVETPSDGSARAESAISDDEEWQVASEE
ncbi:MAG: hypothetical protein ACYC5O_22460 [Anaerolineae bacterium]